VSWLLVAAVILICAGFFVQGIFRMHRYEARAQAAIARKDLGHQRRQFQGSMDLEADQGPVRPPE
jgi:hypothetical protein